MTAVLLLQAAQMILLGGSGFYGEGAVVASEGRKGEVGTSGAEEGFEAPEGAERGRR